MGKKYGSIHIKADSHQTMTKAIAELLGEQMNEHLSIAEKLEQISKHRLCQGLAKSEQSALRDLARSYCHQPASFFGDSFSIISEKWFSLYSRDLSFQDIISKAAFLSQKFSGVIVYASNFDDDVFICGVIIDGKTVTSGQICNDPDIYNLTTKTADMAALGRALGEEHVIPTKMPTDVYEMEMILSDAMGVPLHIFEEFVHSDPEHYEKVEELYGVRVYKKIG